MTELLKKENILADIEKTKKDLKWVMNDDCFAFWSIHTDQATLEMDEDLLKLINNKGLKSSEGIANFFEDNDGNLYKGIPICKPYADMLVILKSGKKAWLDFAEEVIDDEEQWTFTKSAKKYGLHEVVKNIPVYYRLQGTSTGDVYVECYESPVNHVTGEKNQYWEVN